MTALLWLPIVIPLATAIACILSWRSVTAQRAVGAVGAAALLVAAVALLLHVRADGILAVQSGGWPAPFGITLVADLLSAIMVMVTAIIALAVAVYSLANVGEQRTAFGYYPLLHVLLMGVCGSFLTGDMFNMYVWFEVMLIASFVLLALGSERAQLEGAIKYVTLNMVASALFLAALGILYGSQGTLNMADLAVRLRETEQSDLTLAVAMLFLVAFGIKAAIFPLFFWLPASYHTPPAAVSAVFAGLLTKVGVYALLRVFTLLFVGDQGFTHQLILMVAGLTMVTGVLGAVAQNEFRRILSFHIVSQIGYMLMGLGLFTPLALAGSIFYIVHHIIVKANLFLVAGTVQRLRGTGQLSRLGGLYHSHVWLALLFIVPAGSLAGIPPLSGFFAKLALVRAGLDAESYLIVGLALVVSLLTLYSMTKIWNEAFWKPAPELASLPEAPGRRELSALVGPIGALAALTVLVGLAAGPLFDLSQDAASQLLDPQQYVQAVLGAR